MIGDDDRVIAGALNHPMTRCTRSAMRRARRAALGWGLFLLALTSWPTPPGADRLGDPELRQARPRRCSTAWRASSCTARCAWPGRPGFSLARGARGRRGDWRSGARSTKSHQAWIPGRSMEAGDAPRTWRARGLGRCGLVGVTGRARARSRRYPYPPCRRGAESRSGQRSLAALGMKRPAASRAGSFLEEAALGDLGPPRRSGRAG